ncbi:MAG: outer membrane beta-barrel protein [Flavobacteriaceae bacterium]|nr:outer membrane beta-barrel protein [Flavobacteriaceae bacterium]
MRKQLLAMVFVCVTTISFAQINEIGVFIGGTNYIGDIGKTNYILPNKLGGGLIYKYNLNPRIALRGTLSYLPIEADDADATNSIRINRNYNFKNVIKELAVGIEYNFFEYDLSSLDHTFTPYILVELAAFSYSHAVSENAPGQYNFKNKTSYAIPFGLGFKTKLMNSVAFAIETKVRYTFEDDLDYTTNKVPSLNFAGTSNDWYVFTGISIVYTFGRPACYAEFR